MGASEFHSRTVRGKNENYLSASVQVVIAVKVEPSEERVTLVGCLSLSTEIATLPHTALPNRFKRASFLQSERVLQPKSSMSLDNEVYDDNQIWQNILHDIVPFQVY